MTKFETKTCGRCGGSGSYSFNLMHGSTCYGCGGSGLQLSPRGKVAQRHFHDLTTVRAGDVKVGWLLWDEWCGMKPKWYPVLEIRDNVGTMTSNGKDYVLRGLVTRRGCQGASDTYCVRAVPDKETLEARLAEALAYQATLNDKGKPVKTKGAK